MASAAAGVALREPWCAVGLVLFGGPLALIERRWRDEVRPFSHAELDAAREARAVPSAWFDWRLRHALREGRDWDSLSWLSLRALAASLNQVTVTRPMIHELRRRWDERLGQTTAAGGRVVDLAGASSFVVVGDTGEQDKSQYAVAPALVSESDEVDFLVISSDVVYPAGGVNDYVDAVFRPYEGFTKRIFAVPGNHDWYDGLRGFMFHFCGQTGPPPSRIDRSSALRFALSLTWRPRTTPDGPRLAEWRSRVPSFAAGAPTQPGSYYALDLGPLLVVCIDTGMKGDLDADQGRWLEQVSAIPKDKLLVTGKPLVVNQQEDACRIAWPRGERHVWDSVAEIVAEPAHRYAATVGGDIHNHQTYRWDAGERPAVHLVSGGGGAFTSATHAIPPAPVAAPGAGARPAIPPLRDTFPAQSDSLLIYARRFAPRLWQLTLGLLAAWAGLAAATVALLVLEPSRGSVDHADFATAARDGLVAGAAAVGAWCVLLRVGLGSRGREAIAPWRRHVSRAVSLVFGAVLAGAAWWLFGEGSAELLGGAAVAALLASGWARVLRGGRLAVLARKPKLETAATLALGAVAAVAGTWWLVAATEPSWGHVAAVCGLVVAVVVVPPVFIDFAQTKLRTKYQYAVVAAAVALVAGLVALAESTGPAAWIPGAVAGIVASLSVVVLIVLSAYAVFFGALGLVFRPGARTGVFETGPGESEADVARAMLAWQQARRAGRDTADLPPTTSRNRQITHIAMLGKGSPGSAVLDKTSEIFDSDEPPFQKSYLRFRLEDRREATVLVIEGVSVTGEERSRADLGALWPEPLEIPLGEPGPMPAITSTATHV